MPIRYRFCRSFLRSLTISNFEPMTKLLYRSFTFLFIGLFLNACVEQVDLDEYLESSPTGRLVVEGIITDDRKPHEIRLTRTGRALPDDSYTSVSGADVSISDGTLVYPLKESDSDRGVYRTDSISGEVNKTYTLTVSLEGKVYQASDAMVTVMKFGRAEGIILNGTKPPKGYITTPLIVFGSNAPATISIEVDNPRPDDKYNRLDYYTFPGVHPDDILPKYVDAHLSYDEGTQLTQKKYSLSDAHYKFLRAMLLETEYKGGIFGSVRQMFLRM